MAYMRKTTTIGAALMVAAAGVAVSNATAGADPDGAHEVTYTITAADSLVAKIYYISADPPSMADYNADSAKYLTSVQQPIAPGSRWSTRSPSTTPASGRGSTPAEPCGCPRISGVRSLWTVRLWSPSRAAAG